MRQKSLLFQISTRSWIRQLGAATTLSDVPTEYWENLVAQGFEFVWLMGVWQTSISSIERYCFHPDLTKQYDEVAPDWKRSDVWGSPYAVEDYIPHRRLGTENDLLQLKEKINRIGLKLILDFVPNHFNAESTLISKHPEVFMQGSEADLNRDSSTYYAHAGGIFAHGRDPHFPAWSDTVQVNYYEQVAQDYMVQKLEEVSAVCDGVRCDMAMLLLPDVFHQTWHRGDQEPPDFWTTAISAIKSKKEFVFIAEAYWDREAQLQEKGFDYCYDKGLLDLLVAQNHDGLHHHLSKGVNWFEGAITFLENHDEERSLKSLGFEKSRAAAVIASTLPGLHLFFDGQFSGATHRVPVQLALQAHESKCVCTLSEDDAWCYCQKSFYKRLLLSLAHPSFHGEWERIDGGNHQCYASTWNHGNEKSLVCTNYSREVIRTKLSCAFSVRRDLLNDTDHPNYVSQEGEEIHIDLPPYRSVILI